MLSEVKSGSKPMVGINKIGIFPYQSKITKKKYFTTGFEIYLQRADQPQLIFVHLKDTKPLKRDKSITQGKWEREHAGYLLLFLEPGS